MYLSYLDIINVQQGKMLDEDTHTSYQMQALQQHYIVLCLALKTANKKMNGLAQQTHVRKKLIMRLRLV
jgi:hypothetical protein